MRSPSHPALRCGIQEYRQRSSRAPTRDPENTGKFTRKILFPGPRIAVRGDTVLDAVSRIYPLFISKGNSRQYRLGHWGARPPLFFSRKRKGKAKRKLPADVRKLKNRLRGPGKKNSPSSLRSSRSAGYTAPGSRPIHFGSNIFSLHSSLSAIFPSAFSHRPDWAARFGHRPRCGHPVIPYPDAESREYRQVYS